MKRRIGIIVAILSCALNWEKKGGDKALGAYCKLINESFPCTLTIIGSTPPEMPKEDEDLTG